MEIQLIFSIIGSLLMLGIFFAAYFYLVNKELKVDAEKVLVEKNNFETISQKANDIILVIDIVTGSIYNANNQASEMLGYSIPELCKKTIHKLHPKELLSVSAQTIAEVWEKKGLVYQNLPFVTVKNEILEVECSAKVQIYNDKPVIIIYARDIRERLKLEREIKVQNDVISEKNINITASITYARRIQQAVLGHPEIINNLFKNAFVFFKPHSIVSGDFYWFRQAGYFKIIVAADCTGHGVPGAFMTVLGHNFLEEIVDNQKIIRPDKILYELNNKVSNALNKDEAGLQINDGMDVAILTFDEQNRKLYYSGAKNPLCMVQNGNLEVVKASRNTIGGKKEEKEFELHTFDYVPDSMLYIYSDGFQDQFGGKEKRKFLVKNIRNLFLELSNYEIPEQKSILDNILNAWKGDIPQTDDILIIGIKIQ